MILVSAFAETNNAVIVSAPRLDNLDLMAVDTAADVTVINRQAIEQSGAVSVPDLLQTEANILIRSSSGNGYDGQISMRGFGENSHLRTLVLVDGHKLNRPDMGGLNWQSVPVSNIERIEVIRGGQNVLYGDRAVGGVVKITTKRGAESGASVGGRMGSFGYISGFAGYGDGVGDADYYVGVDAYDSEGFRSNSASRAITYSGSLSWYAGDNDIFTFRLSQADSHYQFPGPLNYAEMMEDPAKSTSDGTDYSDTDDAQATLLWESDQDWGAARISSGVNYRDMAWMLGGIDAENRQFGASLGPRIRWGSENEFLMGGIDLMYDQVEFESFKSQEFSGLRMLSSEADLDRYTCAPYLFAQKELSRQFLVNGGVRYEYARTDNLNRDYENAQLFPTYMGNRGEYANPAYKNPPDLNATNSFDGIVSKEGWSAEISIVYELAQDWSVWSGYDRMYRYPSLDETASYQEYPLSDPLNENLDPETGHQFEAGLKGGINEWKFSCTAFCMMMDNEIVFVEIPDSNIRLNANLGATRRYGLESELMLDRQWYGASTRWVFQDALLHGGDNDGNRVPLVPWNYGIFSVWVDPIEQVRMTLIYSYVSDQYCGNNVENNESVGSMIDAYGLLGFRVNVAMSNFSRLEIAVNNLLDEVYATTAYSGSYYPGVGRSFQVGLTLVF